MRVLLLGGANSIHTIRWANGLAESGLDIHLASVHKLGAQLSPRVKYHPLLIKAPWGYVASAMSLKNLIRKITPDILNAHYATGYGLLARLTGFKPLLLSVWGADIYDFPKKSIFHKHLLMGNLSSATAIASTSSCMAKETRSIFSESQIFLTHFGVDEKVFSPDGSSNDRAVVVIGTVKSLKSKYGIDTLIEAYSLAKKAMPDQPMRLEISGDGPDIGSLKALASRLGVADSTVFHGAVPHESVPGMLKRLDVYVALSRLDSESFGVAILEAGACCKPVVVSDADGPAEVVVDGITGFIVPRNNSTAAAEAIIKLVSNKNLGIEMGAAGRAHVMKNYTWRHSIALMHEAYKKTIEIHSQ